MNIRIATMIKLLKEFDNRKIPIKLIDTQLIYLHQAVMMCLLLEKECEENETNN